MQQQAMPGHNMPPIVQMTVPATRGPHGGGNGQQGAWYTYQLHVVSPLHGSPLTQDIRWSEAVELDKSLQVEYKPFGQWTVSPLPTKRKSATSQKGAEQRREKRRAQLQSYFEELTAWAQAHNMDMFQMPTLQRLLPQLFSAPTAVSFTALGHPSAPTQQTTNASPSSTLVPSASGAAPSAGLVAATATSPPSAEDLPLTFGDGPMGLSITSVDASGHAIPHSDAPCDHIVLSAKSHGTPADACPQLQCGMVVKAIQGTPLRGLSFNQVAQMLRSAPRPVTIVFGRTVDAGGTGTMAAASTSAPSAEDLPLTFGDGPMGLSITSVDASGHAISHSDAPCDHIVLSAKSHGTPADACPQLQCGMVVKAIQGTPLRGLSFNQVAQMLRSAPRPVTIVFGRTVDAGGTGTMAAAVAGARANMMTAPAQPMAMAAPSSAATLPPSKSPMSTLDAALAAAGLPQHAAALRELGCAEADDLLDMTDEELVGLGMSSSDLGLLRQAAAGTASSTPGPVSTESNPPSGGVMVGGQGTVQKSQPDLHQESSTSVSAVGASNDAPVTHGEEQSADLVSLGIALHVHIFLS
jgi:hypothetical protein